MRLSLCGPLFAVAGINARFFFYTKKEQRIVSCFRHALKTPDILHCPHLYTDCSMVQKDY